MGIAWSQCCICGKRFSIAGGADASAMPDALIHSLESHQERVPIWVPPWRGIGGAPSTAAAKAVLETLRQLSQRWALDTLKWPPDRVRCGDYPQPEWKRLVRVAFGDNCPDSTYRAFNAWQHCKSCSHDAPCEQHRRLAGAEPFVGPANWTAPEALGRGLEIISEFRRQFRVTAASWCPPNDSPMRCELQYVGA